MNRTGESNPICASNALNSALVRGESNPQADHGSTSQIFWSQILRHNQPTRAESCACNRIILLLLQIVVVATGFEPATSGVSGQRSNQLSYTTMVH